MGVGGGTLYGLWKQASITTSLDRVHHPPRERRQMAVREPQDCVTAFRFTESSLKQRDFSLAAPAEGFVERSCDCSVGGTADLTSNPCKPGTSIVRHLDTSGPRKRSSLIATDTSCRTRQPCQPSVSSTLPDAMKEPFATLLQLHGPLLLLSPPAATSSSRRCHCPS